MAVGPGSSRTPRSRPELRMTALYAQQHSPCTPNNRRRTSLPRQPLNSKNYRGEENTSGTSWSAPLARTCEHAATFEHSAGLGLPTASVAYQLVRELTEHAAERMAQASEACPYGCFEPSKGADNPCSPSTGPCSWASLGRVDITAIAGGRAGVHAHAESLTGGCAFAPPALRDVRPLSGTRHGFVIPSVKRTGCQETPGESQGIPDKPEIR